MTLTINADAAKPIATIICNKIGMYSLISLDQTRGTCALFRRKR
jgi:hypothetical protein